MNRLSDILHDGTTFGIYQIESFLGQGGMGKVYRALNTQLGRVEAIKVLNREFSENTTYRSLIKKEAIAAARIDSPNVVKVFNHGEIDGRPYIAMEFIEGIPLDNCINDLEFSEKTSIALQIANGLNEAHKQSLIHRDIKPGNILIHNSKYVKILDFGLAKIIDPEEIHTGDEIAGTHHYLSPEQLSGGPLSVKSDMFSFGVLLYEMFTGVKPFDGEVSAIVSYAILMEEPDPPACINPDLPGWIDELILKLIAKDPGDRFPEMENVCNFVDSNLKNPKRKQVISQKARYTVSVMDFDNQSGDESWDYFCTGFTGDIRDELSDKTNLIVMSSSYKDDPISVLFSKFRSDFIIRGSLSKSDSAIKLRMEVFYKENRSLVFTKTLTGNIDSIFELRQKAVRDSANSLTKFTGNPKLGEEEIPSTNVDAYEYFLKGKKYYHSARYEELQFAEKMFTKSLQIDPNFAPSRSGLSDLFAYQYMAFSDDRQIKIERAFEEARKAQEINPDLPEAYRAEGRCHMFIGNFTLAEKALQKAIGLNPKYAVGYRTLAWLKETMGEHKTALYWTNMALMYAPNDIETLVLRGIILMDMRKHVDAIAVLHRAVELSPDEGRAYHYLGMVYLRLGAADKALDNFLMGIKYGGDPNSNIEAGYLYIIRGEYEKAEPLLKSCIECGFFPFMGYYILGFLESERGNKETAKAYFKLSQKSADEFSGNPEVEMYALSFKAVALASSGEKQISTKLLDNVFDSDAKDGGIYHCLARGYAVLGMESKANECLSRAITEHAGPSEKEIALDPHFHGYKMAKSYFEAMYRTYDNDAASG